MNAQVNDEPALIYHHTDHGGATGILSNTTFRFSAIDYLNDSAERTHVISYINDCLAREEENCQGDEHVRYLLQQMRHYNRLVMRTNYYIGCFTQSKNELSQWRGYSRTVPSYAIAFRRDALVDATKAVMKTADMAVLHAEEVTYGGPTRRAPRVDGFIQGCIDALRRCLGACGLKDGKIDSMHVRGHADNIAAGLCLHFLQKHHPAFLKHEAFRAEDEFRIAIRHSSPPNEEPVTFGVTAGAATMKPYIEFKYGKDVMRSIIDHMIVGPTPEEQLACHALEQYRGSMGYDFRVEYCNIPFRPGW